MMRMSSSAQLKDSSMLAAFRAAGVSARGSQVLARTTMLAAEANEGTAMAEALGNGAEEAEDDDDAASDSYSYSSSAAVATPKMRRMVMRPFSEGGMGFVVSAVGAQASMSQTDLDMMKRLAAENEVWMTKAIVAGMQQALAGAAPVPPRAAEVKPPAAPALPELNTGEVTAKLATLKDLFDRGLLSPAVCDVHQAALLARLA